MPSLDDRSPRITAVCLTILTAIAVGGVLFVLRDVLVPMVLALLVAIVLQPMVDGMVRRLGVPRWMAVSVALVAVLLVLLLFSSLVAISTGQLGETIAAFETIVRQIYKDFHEILDDVAEAFDRVLRRALGNRAGDRLANAPDSPTITEVTGFIAGYLAGVAGKILSLLSVTALILVLLMFLLMERRPPADQRNEAFEQICASIRRYLLVKSVISVTTGLAVGGILELFGVPGSILFGLLAFGLNFIPNIGSLVATLLPIPVVLLTDHLDPACAVLAIVLPGVVQAVLGNIVEPRVFGNQLDLNPVVVLVGLVFWGALWGIPGVFMSVPLTVAIKIVLTQLGYTKPIADLLASHRVTQQAARRSEPIRPT